MIRFTFPADTRERYGLPETVEYDPDRPRLSEVKALRKQVGLSFPELFTRLKARDWEAMGTLFWLAAIHAGATVSWDDFDVDLDGVELEQIDEGNSPAPDGASTD